MLTTTEAEMLASTACFQLPCHAILEKPQKRAAATPSSIYLLLSTYLPTAPTVKGALLL